MGEQRAVLGFRFFVRMVEKHGIGRGHPKAEIRAPLPLHPAHLIHLVVFDQDVYVKPGAEDLRQVRGLRKL